jgi:hypothetical protein
MNKQARLCILCGLFFMTAISVFAQESAAITARPNTKAPVEENWLKGSHWYDLRAFDWPNVGIFTAFNHSFMFRFSMPMAFPVVAITPVNLTYASSWWGANLTFMDFTLGIDFDKIGKEGIILSDTWLMRPLPLEIWAGLPLNEKGMGIYFLTEFSFCSFFSKALNYPDKSGVYIGPGMAWGVKFMVSKRMEVEARYEMYTNYGKFNVWQPYLGITFRYRSSDPGYHGVW